MRRTPGAPPHACRAAARPFPCGMTRQQRADLVARHLAELYPAPAVPLAHRDPYTLLVAVLLSAQCTDKRVNEVTPALFARAGDAEAMASVPVAEIQAIVRPCGLAPQKAKAIRGLSEILVAQHGGAVPRGWAALEALPGVGHKTASVVMAQAFGEPAFPVDTHIHRLAQRWGLSDGRSVEQTERDLKALFPREQWNVLHLQIIYYGREHCTARGCDGTICPVCRELFPGRRKAVTTRRRLSARVFFWPLPVAMISRSSSASASRSKFSRRFCSAAAPMPPSK